MGKFNGKESSVGGAIADGQESKPRHRQGSDRNGNQESNKATTKGFSKVASQPCGNERAG